MLYLKEWRRTGLGVRALFGAPIAHEDHAQRACYAVLRLREELHLFEGELHELRAQLAEREGHAAEKTVALQRAHDCYTRFGMTAQAARVAEELSD